MGKHVMLPEMSSKVSMNIFKIFCSKDSTVKGSVSELPATMIHGDSATHSVDSVSHRDAFKKDAGGNFLELWLVLCRNMAQ